MTPLGVGFSLPDFHMRVLVYPHDLSIGGSQINAIDLAAGVANAGHEVSVYGVEGPLVDYVRERGLDFIPAYRARYRPSLRRVAQLAKVVAARGIDIVHAYEWPPGLEAYYGAHLRDVPVLCTVLSMSVQPYLPASIPLVMGTADLARQAQSFHSGGVWTLEPPIDTERDHPDIEGGSLYRERLGVAAGELLVVSVSRLAVDLKLDALVRAIDAADLLADRIGLKLVIVGGGPAHEALRARAQAVNARHRREVVALPGPEADPRAAYAAADLVIGMGSSALRALAVGRPVIVQGEQGFSEVFEPDTLPYFLEQGFYGLSDGAPGSGLLARQMAELLTNPGRRDLLGQFGRKTVLERFSLERAIGLQTEIYGQVIAAPRPWRAAEALRSGWRALRLEIENHDPRRKHARKRVLAAQLDAARSGTWPATH